MATIAEFLASLESDPGKRGRQFEIFVRWFLKNDALWATQVAEVWLWDDYPGRWGVDCGIDLVFRHKNGKTWAVQAKCYSPEQTITKHDVDKFLSESNRNLIDKRLLIATTDHIGQNARQVCDAQEKEVVRFLLANFESADIEYPATFADLPKARRKDKPQPREHQKEAIAAVAANFQDSDRGQLIMACGTGKTFTTLWIRERLSAGSTLVLLPSLGLLSQTLHEWTLAANEPFDVLCVCSDETVGRRGADESIASVADLAFPVTSEVAETSRFLRRPGSKVLFSTYQSSPLVAQAQADATVPDFDLAVADEAHRCAGKVSSDFSTILDAGRIRSGKRLFATATPRTYSTSVKKAAEDRGIDVVGMDDERVFGKVLFALPFGEAIRRGLLTDYRVVIIGVDNPTIAEWIENRELLKTDSGIESDAESLAAQIGLLKAFKDYDLRRVISFHSRIGRAEAFTKDIDQVAGWVGKEHLPAGTLRADFVSGEMPTDRRRSKLGRLKALSDGERALLTNARCLSEGVDVPSLDGVAFIDPRSSQIDIIQAVGRAIRLSPDKKAGTVVLPVFIEAGDSPVASIEASHFKPVWDVLNALKAHDDVLSAQMDQIRLNLGRKAGFRIDPEELTKIRIDLPASVDPSFGEALRTQLVERVTASWEFWFGLLERYIEENGDARVPQSHVCPNGFKLGIWLNNQRRIREMLNADRKARLESLAGWVWDPKSDEWEEGFRHLLDFVKTNGNSRVSSGHVCQDGYRLGSWLVRQRTLLEILDADRKARLESLPGWTWDPRSDDWEGGFRHLLDFVAANGHARVPGDHVCPDGFRLGRWVIKKRTKEEVLDHDRKARLESLQGWMWNSRENAWEEGFLHLLDFVKANGHARVPSGHVCPDGFNLGGWIITQRSKRQKPDPERRSRLESLAGWTWDSRENAWEVGFRHLQDFVAANGHARFPRGHVCPDGYRLDRWVNKQRANRKHMPPDRAKRLESLSGWAWDPFGD